MNRPDTGTSPELDRLARELAPSLLGQAIEDSRRDAAQVIREQLTQALVREMTGYLRGGLHDSPEPVTDIVAKREAREPAANPVPMNGWYVYGVTWKDVADAVRHFPGIDGASVETVTAGRLAAVVSPVAAEGQWGVDAGGDIDMASLGPRACDHERILEEILERGPVLPLRFGVMYPSVEAIQRVLERSAPGIETELSRLAGYSEWGITLLAGTPPPAGAVHDISAAGRDYLGRRRQERRALEAQRAETDRARQAIHDRLVAASTAGVVLAASKSEPGCLLRASYLVRDEGLLAFRTAAEEALADAPQDLGINGELTGPWPPYHFTDMTLYDGVPA